MNVLLINICLRPDVDKILFPVGLGYIASAIHRAKHNLEIVDMDVDRISYETLENRIREIKFDVLGMGCIVTGYRIVKKIAKIARKINKNAKIIAGNSVASSIPEILLKNTEVDIAVIGEGDITIVELLNAIENNLTLSNIDGICYKDNKEIIKTDERKVIKNINDINNIDYKLFNIEKYLSKSKEYVSEPYPTELDRIRAFAVNTARGCAFNCTFCYHVFKGNPYRTRSADNIIDEIKFLQENYGVNYINFWDELTFFSINKAKELVDKIEKSGLSFYWTASCRGNLFSEKDEALLKKIKRSGCIGLGYSLESANKKILMQMNKKLDPVDFIKQKKALDKAGIVTWTSLVIGYPDETEESIRETFDLCYENNIYPSVGFLLPQPGTEMYKYAVNNGFIKNEEEYLLDMGDRQDLRLNITNLKKERIVSLVKRNLSRIAEKLKLNIDETDLIKTKIYRAKQQNS